MSTARPLTDEQQVAISTRDVSVALDAGAGCGKTFVLTERFLSHLQPGPDCAELHELVAITFTDAAAREMRDRIRGACRERLRQSDKAEGDHWLAMLRSIDSARVQTIHVFCSSLIREHAIALGLDPQFQLLNEGTAAVLRSEVIDQTLRERLIRQDPMTMDLAAKFDLTSLKNRLRDLLPHTATPSFTDWLSRTATEQSEAWQRAYERDYLPRMHADFEESPELKRLSQLLAMARPVSDSYLDTHPQLIQLVERLLDEGIGENDLALISELARVRGVTTKADWPDADHYQEYKNVCTKLRDKAGKVRQLADAETLETTAQLCLDLARLAAETSAAYTLAKRERGVLDFDDLLSEAHKLLTAPELPEVRKQIASQLRLLLVDEFQDTDRIQVEIVEAVVGSGLASGGLFFVGDFKQSIYRFRGAEPDVFRELQKRIPEAGRLPLAMNFRSQPAIIDFVNKLFAPVFGDNYMPLRDARPQVTEKPVAEFLWTHTEKASSFEATRRSEARSIAKRIRELIDSQAPLAGQQNDNGKWQSRPVRPGDIAILFRSYSDVAIYERALRDQELPYNLAGSRTFYSQQEVYDVANLLRVVSSECDEVALLGLLRSPFFSLHDESLYQLSKLEGGLAASFASSRLIRGLSEVESAKLQHARETIAELRAANGQASIVEVLTLALERTGFDAILLTEYLGDRKLANLQKLVEQAREFDSQRYGDLDGFVRQLNEFVAKAPKEADAALRLGETDEIQLMTVHSSKGLEFPVVVLADVNRRDKGDTSAVAFRPELGPLVSVNDAPNKSKKETPITGIDIYRALEKQASSEELQRLFYVACTRAADYLIISSALKHQESGERFAPEGAWLKTIDERFDLETGHLAGQSSGTPMARVTWGDPREVDVQRNHVNRVKTLEQATAMRASAPESVLPLAIDPTTIRKFSVSRLTGRLQHGVARPATVGVESALAAEQKEVDPRGLGTLVHAVLERLPMPFHTESQATLIGKWCQELAPLHVHRKIDVAAQRAAEMIERFVQGPRFSALASASRIDREIEFLLRWPSGNTGDAESYLQGYIDCLAFDNDGAATVLDFKTNRVEASDVEQAAEPYRLQMYVYALAVEQSMQCPPSELRLHFLRPGAEVAFAWDDPARERASELINQAIEMVRAETVEQSTASFALRP